MDKKEYISKLGSFLSDNQTTMSGNELADHLNRNDFKTNYETEFEGGRGTYKLIHSTYDWLIAGGETKVANDVARAFTKPDGTYAFEK